MYLSYVTQAAEWDEAARSLPLHHILQSWAWGEFKGRWGWQATRLLWLDGQRPVAAAQFLRRPLPRTPLGIGYVSKGPLLAAHDAALADQLLSDLEAEARRQRCLFVKIDPDLLASETPVVRLLQARGWRRGEPIQFVNTGTLDLRPDDETLLAAMKSKTRYNIRLAERRGVEVRDGTPGDFPLFYRMYAETGERDGFLIRPAPYYLDLWRSFHAQGLAHLLLAWVEGEPVAGIMLFRFGERAWYFYGASTALHRNAMPNHALQWAAIRWCKGQGVAEYDWWGAPDDLADESDSMAGVWRFKEGFAAEFREQIGAWDFPAMPLGYRLFEELIPRIRARLRGAAPAGAAGGG